MALTGTESWEDVAVAWPALCATEHRESARQLVQRLRADDFPYRVFPESDRGRLNVYPAQLYDFDLLFGRQLSFLPFSEQLRSRLDKFRVTHVHGNYRLEIYETRFWEIRVEHLNKILPDLFDEVGWPLKEGGAVSGS
jgi:hypothetical protein